MRLRTWRRLGRPRPPLVPAKSRQQGSERKWAAWSPGPQPSGVGTAQPRPPSAPQRQRTLGCPGHRGEAEGGQRQTEWGGGQGHLTQDPGSSLAQPQLGGKMGCRPGGGEWYPGGCWALEGQAGSRRPCSECRRACASPWHQCPPDRPPRGPLLRNCLCGLEVCLSASLSLDAPGHPGASSASSARASGHPLGRWQEEEAPTEVPPGPGSAGHREQISSPPSPGLLTPPGPAQKLRRREGLYEPHAGRAPAQSPDHPGPFPTGPFPRGSRGGEGRGRLPLPLTTETLLNREPKCPPGPGPAHPEAGDGWGEGGGSRQGQGWDIPFLSPASWSGQGRGAGTTEPVPRTGMDVMWPGQRGRRGVSVQRERVRR